MPKNFGLAKAVGQFGAARSALPFPASPATADSTTSSGGSLSADSTRLQEFIASRRPALGVATVPWSMGVGDVIASHPSFPSSLQGVAGRLNKVGGVSISPTGLAIDGEHVEWSAISVIRTRTLVDHLLSGAMSEQLDSLPLPAFPGRKRLVDALGRSVLAILMKTAREQVNGVGGFIQIPAEIEYKGKIRKRTVAPNVISTLILADSAVNGCLFATSQSRGVAVCGSPTVAGTAGDAQGNGALHKLAQLESKLT